MIGRPSRRCFLKTLGAGGALIASPVLAQTAWTIEGSERGVLRLVFYGDVHARTEWETPTALMMAAGAINAQKADLVLGGGDLITDGFDSTSEEVAPRWDAYMAMHSAIEGEHHAVIGHSGHREGFLPHGFVPDGFHKLVAAPGEHARGPAKYADSRSILAPQQPGVVEERNLIGNLRLVVALEFRVDELVGILTFFDREHHHPDQLHISFHAVASGIICPGFNSALTSIVSAASRVTSWRLRCAHLRALSARPSV